MFFAVVLGDETVHLINAGETCMEAVQGCWSTGGRRILIGINKCQGSIIKNSSHVFGGMFLKTGKWKMASSVVRNKTALREETAMQDNWTIPRRKK